MPSLGVEIWARTTNIHGNEKFKGAGLFGTHGTMPEMWSCMYMLTGVNLIPTPMIDLKNGLLNCARHLD